jgi:biopolymer transport protein ExbB
MAERPPRPARHRWDRSPPPIRPGTFILLHGSPALELLRDNLDYAVIGVLGFMSFLMLWLVIERYLYFARVDLSRFTDTAQLELDLTRNLTTIATIGSNAPYVGLLGTVVGILIAFFDMGQAGAIETKTIMQGLALALKATALGLLVAIPAIVFYNALLRRVEILKVRWQSEHAR